MSYVLIFFLKQDFHAVDDVMELVEGLQDIYEFVVCTRYFSCVELSFQEKVKIVFSSLVVGLMYTRRTPN